MVAFRFTWEQALRRTSMPSTRKLVALMAATYASADGTRVRPGISELAEVCGLQERAVRGHLVALRASGWLERTFRGSSQGRRAMADEYRLITPDQVHAGAPDRREHRHVGAPDPDRNTGTKRQEHRHVGAKNTGTYVPPTRSETRTRPNQSARDPIDLAAVALDELIKRRPGKANDLTEAYGRKAAERYLDGREPPPANPEAYLRACIRNAPEHEIDDLCPTPQPPRYRPDEGAA